METTGGEIKSVTNVAQNRRSVASLQVTHSIGSNGSNNLHHRRRREASCHLPTADRFFLHRDKIIVATVGQMLICQ